VEVLLPEKLLPESRRNMRKIVTIERFIFDNQPETAAGDLTNLLYDIALAAKAIASQTARAGLVDILGQAGSVNIQGEDQQKLDIYADQVIRKLCDNTGRLCVLASEEHEDIIQIPLEYPKGRYVLIYDPLDGSSNIDANVSTGTIFSIFRCRDWDLRGRLEDCLQSGNKLVAAGYVLYGTSTMLVYSTGSGVHGFTLDPDLGEFLLTYSHMQFPEPAKFFSVNHGYHDHWSVGIRKYVRLLPHGSGANHTLSDRYVGSLVADFHRNLLAGGIFLYPAQDDKPRGKLRLLYEASPLAFLANQAGGYASDGHISILDIEPTDLHQRVPLFVGNRSLVEQAEEFIRKYDFG
jgi:fructose-1,6-bisphosphatase I